MVTPTPNFGGLAGVPLPPAETWLQFPIIAVIVLCLALFGTAVFVFTKWVWAEYKKEREADRQWRESQNKLREAAAAEQNQLWRDAMMDRDMRWERSDLTKQETLAEIAKATAIMISKLEDHDDRAVEIKKSVDEITRRLPKR